MNTGNCTVVVGEGVVTLHRKGRAPVVANVLGDEQDDAGRRIVLDRRIHDRGEDEIDGWRVSGPVVTVLERATEGGGN